MTSHSPIRYLTRVSDHSRFLFNSSCSFRIQITLFLYLFLLRTCAGVTDFIPMKDMDESQRGPVNSTTVLRVKSTWLKQVYWLAVRCVCVSVSVCVCVCIDGYKVALHKHVSN